MNQENFNKFAEIYRAELLISVKKNPDDYFLTQSEKENINSEQVTAKILNVADKMLNAIASDQMVDYNSNSFKRTCKKLGIKYSRKAILEYLDIK